MEQELVIVRFQENLAIHFTELNLAWIKKYFSAEPMDHKILSDPQNEIIKRTDIFFSLL